MGNHRPWTTVCSYANCSCCHAWTSWDSPPFTSPVTSPWTYLTYSFPKHMMWSPNQEVLYAQEPWGVWGPVSGISAGLSACCLIDIWRKCQGSICSSVGFLEGEQIRQKSPILFHQDVRLAPQSPGPCLRMTLRKEEGEKLREGVPWCACILIASRKHCSVFSLCLMKGMLMEILSLFPIICINIHPLISEKGKITKAYLLYFGTVWKINSINSMSHIL